MNLKLKSLCFFALILLLVGAMVGVFIDYDSTRALHVAALQVSELTHEHSHEVQDALREGNMQRAATAAVLARRRLRRLRRTDFTGDLLDRLLALRISFLRVEKLIPDIERAGASNEAIAQEAESELDRIGAATRQFSNGLTAHSKQLSERSRQLMLLFLLVGFVAVGGAALAFFRVLVRPIMLLSDQVRGVREGRLSRIAPSAARDEVGQLSRFTATTLSELGHSSQQERRRYEEQHAISSVLKASQRHTDVDGFLHDVLETVLSQSWLGVHDVGLVFLLNAEGKGLELRAARYASEVIRTHCAQIGIGHCLCGQAAATGRIIYSATVDHRHQRLPGMEPHGHYCVPIGHEGRVLGVLTLYLTSGQKEDADALAFLENVAIIVAECLIRKRLVEREHVINAAIDALGEGVIIADGCGNIEYANAAAASMGDVAGRDLAPDLKAELVERGLDAEVAHTVGKRAVLVAQVSRPRAEGGAYGEQLTVLRVSPNDSSGQKLVCLLRDVSRERDLEQQLRQAQKMEVVGRLAGGVAHDFNNFLTAIMGFGSTAMMAAELGQPVIEDIGHLMAATEKASKVTHQLLAFSRKGVGEPALVDVSGVVEGLRPVLTRLVGGNVTLRVLTQASTWPVWIEEGQIEQVLTNLAVNAKDAMPKGGTLRVEVGEVTLKQALSAWAGSIEQGQYVRLVVADSGVGIPEDLHPQIFEPFFTTKARGQGTGLGLSVVYGVMQRIGGHIRLVSETGQGTSFELYFPRASQSQVEQVSAVTARLADVSNPVAVPSAVGSEFVLIVEDQDEVRGLASRVLTRAGYRVVEACNGEEGLAKWEEHQEDLDLLLTDILMPRIDGMQLVRRIQQAQPSLKLLCMSGYVEQENNLEELRQRSIPFLAKPFSSVELANAVRQTLDDRVCGYEQSA